MNGAARWHRRIWIAAHERFLPYWVARLADRWLLPYARIAQEHRMTDVRKPPIR